MVSNASREHFQNVAVRTIALDASQVCQERCRQERPFAARDEVELAFIAGLAELADSPERRGVERFHAPRRTCDGACPARPMAPDLPEYRQTSPAPRGRGALRRPMSPKRDGSAACWRGHPTLPRWRRSASAGRVGAARSGPDRPYFGSYARSRGRPRPRDEVVAAMAFTFVLISIAAQAQAARFFVRVCGLLRNPRELVG